MSVSQPQPRRAHFSATGGLPSNRQRRLVVFSALEDEARYRQRCEWRRRILSMDIAPEVQTQRPAKLLVPKESSESGLMWALMMPNGLSLAMRARDHSSLLEVQVDAAELVTRASDAVLIPVQNRETGMRAWWITVDDKVVVVAGRTWRAQYGDAAERAGHSALRLLGLKTPWGELGWSTAHRQASRTRV